MKEGWEVKTLEKVCERIFAGGDVPKNNLSKFKTDKYTIPIFANGEKNKGLYGYTDISKVVEPSITVSARGTIGYSEIRNEPFFPIVRLIVLIPNKEIIDLNFLKYIVSNMEFKKSGTSIPQLTVPMIKKYEANIPPLPEQTQIVKTLESAFAQIDQAKANLEKNLANAKELFQSKLNEIFSQRGEGWSEKKLGDVCIKNKNIKWNDNQEKEFQYIDLSSVSRETLKITKTTIINRETAPSRAKKIVNNLDVIFATTRPTLKRVTLIEEELDNQICSTGFVVLKSKKDLILSELIYYFLQTTVFMNRMKELERGASYPAVSDKDVNETVIIFPISKEEQMEIVKELNSLSELSNILQTHYQQKLNNLEELKKSILEKAFRGEL